MTCTGATFRTVKLLTVMRMSFVRARWVLLGLCAFGDSAYAAYNPSTFAAPPAATQILPYPILNYITPQMYGAKCDGSTDDRTAFFNANAAAASINAALQVQKSTGECVIGSNLTLTASLNFIQGGIIKPSSGSVTVTVNAPIAAGIYQIFDVSAGGIIAGNVPVPKIYVGWFNSDNSNAARLSAFQVALNLTASSTNTEFKHATVSLCGASPSGGAIYNIGTSGVSLNAADLPNIEGCAPYSTPGPDSTNLVMSPGSPGAAIHFTGTTAPCGCGVRGIFFDGNSNTIGVQFTSLGGGTFANNSASTTIGTVLELEDGASNQFSENTQIYGNYIGGLVASETFVAFVHSSGTGSFAGTTFGLGNYVGLNSGARSIPIISNNSGAFPYNACINLNVHNTGAGAVYIFDNKESGQAIWFNCGGLQLEGSNANPIGIANPADQPVYLGAGVAVTAQGYNNADLSGVTFCRNFDYDISITCQGGSRFGLKNFGAGNTTIAAPTGLNATNFSETIDIEDTFGTSGYDYAVQLQCYQNNPTFSCVKSNEHLRTDPNSFGSPTLTEPSGVPSFSNSNWPSGSTFTIFYGSASQSP